MVKTQWYFSHHKMKMIIQAAATVFLKKGSVCRRDYKSFVGVNLARIAAVWILISPDISGKLRIKNLLTAVLL